MMPLCFCLLMLLLPSNVHIPQWKNKPSPNGRTSQMAYHSNIELSWTELNHLSIFAYRLSRSQDAWGGMPDHCLSLPVWWWDSWLPPSLCPTEVRIMEFMKDKQGPAFSMASAHACVNSHPVCSRIHRTVILQQPVVISPVYRNHFLKKSFTKAFLTSGERTCLCFWWCNRGPRAAQTAAGVDGWCFQAEAQLQTSEARNLHPCIHQQTAGKNQPGQTAMQNYIQVRGNNHTIFQTECSNYSKPLPLVAVQSCGIFGPPLVPSPELASFHETSPCRWHCSWMFHLPGTPPTVQILRNGTFLLQQTWFEANNINAFKMWRRNVYVCVHTLVLGTMFSSNFWSTRLAPASER